MSPDPTNVNPRAITITLDPDQPLPDRYLGTTEDGPEYGPVTLTDAVIAAAVHSLVGYGEKYVREFIGEHIKDAVTQAITERLPVLIDEALAGKVTYRDTPFGTEHTRSAREIIVEEARKQLDLTRLNQRSVHDMNTASRYIHEQVGKVIHRDLEAELRAARDAVKAQVTAKAAELLAAESLRAAGIR